jgi:glycine/D-amino acid oxidase-like deaminating enzyme
MIATEPLTEDQWSEIGLAERTTFADHRHLIIYGQRTADGRLAFGGRGAPYHFGSRIDERFDTDESVKQHLITELRMLFPSLDTVGITHHWGGPLAIPRDWTFSVDYDRHNGIGRAGGYVGDGVATSHLAGRTLADLVLGRDTPRTALPFVSHRSRRWEPEPLRWTAINGMARLAAHMDRAEGQGRRPSRLIGSLIDRVTGS